MEIKVVSNPLGAVTHIEKLPSATEGVELYDLGMSFPVPTPSKPVQFRFNIPIVDIYAALSPWDMFNPSLRTNWSPKQSPSGITGGCPILTFLSSSGENRLTVTHSEGMNNMNILTGVDEFSKTIEVNIVLLNYIPVTVTDYHIKLWLDSRRIRYDEAIASAVSFWENDCGLTRAHIPDVARRPLYSCWYTFHQDIDPDEVVKQCALAKEYGMDSVILDDGWQCDDKGGGYRYCGDWEVAESKIPDMRSLVSRVHDTGMKFILWYNFAGVGIYSKAHEKYKDMLLNPGDPDCAELDPRFPEVREYLISKYRSAIEDWDLDGFKLDFVDAVYNREGTKDPNDDMDYATVEAALDRLLTDICTMARSYKPDFVIEFRQMFFGPQMRKFATMFRVGDCANDSVKNRIIGTGMRLILGSSPVHSDMVMWSPDDTGEGVAAQLISCMFTVPQISVPLDSICDEHKKVLGSFLSFWNAHRDTILDGKLEADNPEALYSLVRAMKDGETVAVAYTKPVIDLTTEKAFIFNMTDSDTIFVRSDGQKFTYTVRDCFGEYVTDGVSNCTLTDIIVPHCGMVEITF